MTYDQALDYIDNLLIDRRPPLAPGERLARIERLLSAIGLRAPRFPVVLVAGTKGKGSTSTMLASILAAAGRRVGLYTKPHVSDYRERIRIGGEPIAPEMLADLVARIAPSVEKVAPGPGGRPSYFEVSLALALMDFAERGVDLAIVEVGIGGRHDAANALDPIMSVITPISVDHTDQLGPTVETIAQHKAGIMRAGRPVVIAPQVPAADAVLVEESRAVAAHLIRVAEAARWSRGVPGNGGDAFELVTQGSDYGRLTLGLRGRHQVTNAATAVVAAEALPMPHVSSRPAVVEGLRFAVLPGRIECLEGRPAIVMDVAHNPASMAALTDTLAEYFPGRALVLVLGMTVAHDPVDTTGGIAFRARLVVVTEPPGPRALSAGTLAEAIRASVSALEIVPDRDAALDRALAAAAADDVVCVTGSVYLIGALRGRLLALRAAREAVSRRVG